MSFYSTLADAYDDLMSDHLHDILNDYPLNQDERHGEEFEGMLSSYAERIDLMIRIKRKTDDFMPFDNRSDAEIERSFARSFILPFLEYDELRDVRCPVPDEERIGIVISYLADTAKIAPQLMSYVEQFCIDAEMNMDNEEIPSFIRNKYPFALTLHSLAKD